MHEGRLAYEGTLQEIRDATGCESLVQIFHEVLLKRPAQAV